MIGIFQSWVDPGCSVCSVPTTACSKNLHGWPQLERLGSPLIVTEGSLMPWITSTNYQNIGKRGTFIGIP